jgi:hypothetical protein
LALIATSIAPATACERYTSITTDVASIYVDNSSRAGRIVSEVLVNLHGQRWNASPRNLAGALLSYAVDGNAPILISSSGGRVVLRSPRLVRGTHAVDLALLVDGIPYQKYRFCVRV